MLGVSMLFTPVRKNVFPVSPAYSRRFRHERGEDTIAKQVQSWPDTNRSWGTAPDETVGHHTVQ